MCSTVRDFLLSCSSCLITNFVTTIAGCFSSLPSDDSEKPLLAPRIVVDVKADRVWHFQTFEALQNVPDEQFQVPEVCTDDPPVPDNKRR